MGDDSEFCIMTPYLDPSKTGSAIQGRESKLINQKASNRSNFEIFIFISSIGIGVFQQKSVYTFDWTRNLAFRKAVLELVTSTQ